MDTRHVNKLAVPCDCPCFIAQQKKKIPTRQKNAKSNKKYIEILSKLWVQRSQPFAATNKLIGKTKLPKSPNKKTSNQNEHDRIVNIPRSSTTSSEQWTMWWSLRASSASVKLWMYNGLFCSNQRNQTEIGKFNENHRVRVQIGDENVEVENGKVAKTHLVTNDGDADDHFHRRSVEGLRGSQCTRTHWIDWTKGKACEVDRQLVTIQ